ncbi:MAG: PEP/pyruvate-binding domain-containing protein [Desulfoprunum sp.]|uniref:PEP/pyruvate-binding domain-containing protein n=1 Tax=Desulfoprunum sp. TaxID=2020866 RepID=UPI0026814108
MQRIISFFRHIFSPVPEQQLSPEELRIAFRKRYANFRGLLTANNNALQAMADLEKVYYGGDSYRMAFIRSKVTTILVNVFKMIRNLLAMSDGKYKELETIFERIGHDIDAIIERRPDIRQGPFILPLAEVNRQEKDQAGEKMANLGEVAAIPGLTVPQGFVVTSSATRHFLTDEYLVEINRRLQVILPDNLEEMYKGCAEIQQMIRDSPLPPDLEELLYVHYARLERATTPHCRVALRSSALGEDTAGVSFAGLYRTVLGVDRESLVAAYKEIIASKYGARAISYRRKRGYRHVDIEMCVGCLVMVDALVSGVTYSLDPGEEESEVIRINATAGIAKGVVDGTTITDLYLVSREKPHAVVYREMRQDQAASALTYGQIKKLAEAALLLEQHFGQPQDIEWSFDHQGTLYILQSRPMLKSRAAEPEEDTARMAQIEEREAPVLLGGICASSGIASGPVFRVDSAETLCQFPPGAVLVLEHPLPDWAPLLSRAAAVIAEHGSEAGHLATVSREFGIPALFGLPGAMTDLVDGEVVTVNATTRAIYRGRREDLLRMQTVRRNIMAGSPVQRILTDLLQHITPLNLNDPDSPQFKSTWCETLHDITRFCHEKSVSEMFNFGQIHHFDQAAAKRLVGKVPMEWWVIDLADGFGDGVHIEDKSIRIDDIASVPMLAIWQGISAVPWAGPPPVSVRGFGSIIFQSTMRPELDPAVASALTVKNYFLISRNFCNLSVRLGYHYAMIEAYLSDLLTESYVTFRFKGGAADLRRKTVRARLLADVLQHYDFRVELNSDSLLARLKKKPLEYLKQRLQILGYLTLHARQIDMVMNSPGEVNRYRDKFLADIEVMLAGDTPPILGESDHGGE